MRKDYVIFRKQSIQYGWYVTEDKLWSRSICKTKEESGVKENIRKTPPWWRFRGNSNTHCYLILYTIWALSLLLPVLSQNLPLKCKCRWKVTVNLYFNYPLRSICPMCSLRARIMLPHHPAFLRIIQNCHFNVYILSSHLIQMCSIIIAYKISVWEGQRGYLS